MSGKAFFQRHSQMLSEADIKIYVASVSGVYCMGKTFHNIIGIPYGDDTLIFSCHDGSGDTKMIGVSIRTYDAGTGSMKADHHRIATGEINLADAAAVTAAFETAPKHREGQQHRAYNIAIVVNPIFKASMNGKYCMGKAFDNIVGIPYGDDTLIFSCHDGSGYTKMIGVHMSTYDPNRRSMKADHHRIATGVINLANAAAVTAAFETARKNGEGQQHTAYNVAIVSNPILKGGICAQAALRQLCRPAI
eukprot:TRINITY_DN6510_c0_g1_i2.p1 TRINITY_DN6510_c0_g1~~TRINITY_DN6510_c0_g1_i2.p1  ORF type:complete len:249 (-),score=34.53 TRINITY_DN6510_c0_g1_i2:311-1057(-)